LAQQFSLAGGGEFKQPLLPGESGMPHPKNVLALATGCDGITSLAPVRDSKWDTAGNYSNISAQGPFNNIALPGMRVADYTLNDYIATLNFLKPGELPYASRFYHDVHYSPLAQQQYTADNIKPTFFTLWMGFFDVFLYAQSGGIGNPNPVGLPLLQDITPQDVFESNYDSAVQHMVGTGAKGVLMNIPDILSMPYFTTVPTKAADGSYFLMKDGASTRHMLEGEMLLLEMPIDSLKCANWGTTVPIPGQWVLSLSEIASIRNAIAGFNTFIKAEAAKYDLAFVDVNAYLKTLEPGIIFNGVTYNTRFVEGGAFSLDGLHFTPRGYALVANQVINVINNTYHSTLPQVDVNKYTGVLFP
jgi:hypothetical protein